MQAGPNHVLWSLDTIKLHKKIIYSYPILVIISIISKAYNVTF